jgi:hypothetical protein
MAKKTLHDRLVDALVARGHPIDRDTRALASRKYTRLFRKKDKDGKPTYYFVGKAGALRFGRNATDSIALGDAFKEKLLSA